MTAGHNRSGFNGTFGSAVTDDRSTAATYAVNVHSDNVSEHTALSAQRLPFDPVIVKFYEDIIWQLQKEISHYKRLLSLTNSTGEPISAQVPREHTPPSDAFKKRFLHSAAPTLRVPGHEI